MEQVMPVFKDQTDKMYLILTLIAGIFFGFIPFIIVFLCCKENFSENSFRILKGFLNFELILFIIFLFALVPVVGWIVSLLLCPIAIIVNVIIIIMALLAIGNNQPVNVPNYIKFVN